VRIVITGARGRLGRYAAEFARGQGAEVLGVDLPSAQHGAAVPALNADLTDLGQTYDALYGADAVIHLAAIPAQRIYPSAHTFLTNVGTTWNVFEAAARLGVPRVVAASSIQVIATARPRSPLRYRYLPLDEAHPADPQDDYGLSKLAGEQCATMFAAHWGLSAVSFRFPWITMPEQLAELPRRETPQMQRSLYAYLDVRDAARACYLAATAQLPPRSHNVLYAAARETTLDMLTRDYVRLAFPEAELRAELEGYATLLDCARAKELIGFEPEYSFR
jgi:nucleoside-diphosphate-sugar epimerase